MDQSGGPDACWPWIAGHFRHARFAIGYGAFKPSGEGNNIAAHRFSWALNNGPIPEGIFVCHKCDNPPCVNPSHLFLGTHQDNVADMIRKGRQTRGDAHYSRRTPEKLARGDNHWSRRHPEKVTRGDAYWSRKYPERVRRGETNGYHKLTDDKVRAIRALAPLTTHTELALLYGVSQVSISGIVRRATWKHVH